MPASSFAASNGIATRKSNCPKHSSKRWRIRPSSASRHGRRPGQNNDFPSFRPLLEKTIELKRQQAEALGYPECPYDALLDEYEPEA